MSDRVLSVEEYLEIAQITPKDTLMARNRASGITKDFINAEAVTTNGDRIRAGSRSV